MDTFGPYEGAITTTACELSQEAAAKSSKVPSGDMTRKPGAKVLVVAGLLAGSVAAVVGYVWMYVAAAYLGYDDSALKLSEATPHEVATSYAGIAGFYGLVLGALLIFGRRPWASSLFALLPFTWGLVILMLAGRFRDFAVLVALALAVGLIAKLAADFSVARIK